MVPDSKTTLFTAESPELLAKDIYKKDELLKRYLPDLLAVHNQKKEKPQVQLFQGKKGMTEVYEKIYASGEVWFYGTLGDLTRTFPSVTKEVSKRSREQRLKVREILSGTPEDLAYAKTITQNDFYSLRISPEGLNFFTDNAIFGNSVAFFSFNVQFFVVIITSKEIVESLKSLYNMAWQVAKPIT